MGTIAEKLAYLNGTKEAIKDAFEEVGVQIPEGLPFRQYAQYVKRLRLGQFTVIDSFGGLGGEGTYYFEIGTTWNDWVNSPHNTAGFYFNDYGATTPSADDYGAYLYAGSNGSMPTDKIVDMAEYDWAI